ncbi:UNVERIFIED_CONTAM: hypothetical protein Sradi_2041700 [Sesamum radiatum]|uniref:Zinc knuckle CX2CX4HX4C domain-containing protein n=1 Tax=Sesamum radiatum TaxID=300843 RepID=A0AAW2TH89_SESRA
MFVNKKTTEKIGNVIRKFVDVDLATEGHKWRKALRVRVEIAVSEPLKDHVSIIYQGNKTFVLEIRYERLGDFCHVCGILGYKISSRRENLNQNEHKSSPFKFGPWLKTENRAILNPFLPQYKANTLSLPTNWQHPVPSNPEHNLIGNPFVGIAQPAFMAKDPTFSQDEHNLGLSKKLELVCTNMEKPRVNSSDKAHLPNPQMDVEQTKISITSHQTLPRQIVCFSKPLKKRLNPKKLTLQEPKTLTQAHGIIQLARDLLI